MRSLQFRMSFLLPMSFLLSQVVACGNQIVGWPAPDETLPTVSSTTPEADESNVALNTPISVTFSEGMNTDTITNTNFYVQDGAETLQGTVTYAGVTAIFAPVRHLDVDTAYVATVTTGVEDSAGHAMSDNYVWTFTTGTELDTTPPMVTATGTALPGATPAGTLALICKRPATLPGAPPA